MIELIDIFVNNIAPVMIVAGVGYVAGRRLKLESRTFSKLIFNVFSPALVFFLMYDSHIEGHEFGVLVLLIVVFQLIMAAVAYVIGTIEGASPNERAAMIIGAFCLNTGNYGLSIVSFAFGEVVLARAAVVVVGNTILNYTLGVFVSSRGSQATSRALLNILRVPAFYATIAAFTLRGLDIELPPVIFRSVSVIKDAAIPAMLILLGLQLSQAARFAKPMLVSTGVLIRLLIGPLVAVGMVLAFGVEELPATAFILQASMPTAVMTLILAKEYALDDSLMLNLIMATTLLSPFTLSVIILFLRNTTFGV